MRRGSSKTSIRAQTYINSFLGAAMIAVTPENTTFLGPTRITSNIDRPISARTPVACSLSLPSIRRFTSSAVIGSPAHAPAIRSLALSLVRPLNRSTIQWHAERMPDKDCLNPGEFVDDVRFADYPTWSMAEFYCRIGVI